MDWKRVALGTAAYTAVTFPLAVVWHVALFEERYAAFGYFEGEPSFLLGLLTILIQGAILSWLYPRVRFSGSGPRRAGEQCGAPNRPSARGGRSQSSHSRALPSRGHRRMTSIAGSTHESIIRPNPS